MASDTLKKPERPPREVLPEQLRWCCDPGVLDFETTADLKPLEGIIGQDRAVKALRLGVELYGPGYNVFVCGLSGTGRLTTIQQMLKTIRPVSPPAPDRCYVHNFQHPEQPRLLTLPRGKATGFRKDMNRALDFLATRLPQLLEDEQYQRARSRILERYGAQEKEMLDVFSEQLKKDRFALAEIGGVGTTVVPVVAGQPVPVEKLDELVAGGQVDEAQARALSTRQEQLQKQFISIYRKTLELQRAMNLELELLEKETASVLVDSVIEDLKEKYPHKEVGEHLEAVRASILDNLALFKSQGEAEEAEASRAPAHPRPPADPFRSYRVNVVLGHDTDDACPVIIETTPTYTNLFGAVQRTYDLRGIAQSDFMDIRGGSLLQADGGYLVVNALDALIEPGVWKTLKRTLMHGRLEIQAVPDWLMPLGASALKPEPIPVNVKVIMIGEHYLYDLLYAHEEDFKQIFKVMADFDSEMSRTTQTVRQYAALLRRLCEEDKLLHFHRDAVAAVVEFGVRRAGRQDKLSTRFSEIADLAREATYWALKEPTDSGVVQRAHVERAIAERIERHNLIESKIQELIEKGVLLIDVAGERIGQVNGLSVYDQGSYAFGKPVRITASTAMGRQGIINIEREANLSGRLYDKGVAILSGYLRQKFAQNKPMSLAASVCFEQSYSGVDGDSASSTEVYALLSSLSGLPLRQDIAVTGSVNQKGDIQAIGGINYKIEGFYDVCQAKGLTGKQGVLLPIENVADLMLRPDVAEAVRTGKFHLYPVATVDEGIEILTGVKAGGQLPDGGFEEGTVYWKVDRRLRELAEGLREYEARPGS